MQPHPGFFPYPLTMQRKMTRLYGHLFLAPGRLYFVCGKQGGTMLAAIGQSVGGLVGGALVGLGTSAPGQGEGAIDEIQLAHAVSQHPGSLVMEAGDIGEVKETMWWRKLKHRGVTYGFPAGLGKELNRAMGDWCRYHNVKHKGLKYSTPA